MHLELVFESGVGFFIDTIQIRLLSNLVRNYSAQITAFLHMNVFFRPLRFHLDRLKNTKMQWIWGKCVLILQIKSIRSKFQTNFHLKHILQIDCLFMNFHFFRSPSVYSSASKRIYVVEVIDYCVCLMSSKWIVGSEGCKWMCQLGKLTNIRLSKRLFLIRHSIKREYLYNNSKTMR